MHRWPCGGCRKEQSRHDRFSHLNKTFVSRAGKVEALKDVSLTVENGDIYGVIGFSGAGKSTLIRMANLLERPDSGSIKVDGVELTGQTEAQLIPVRRKIGMVFQQFNLLESRTVAQNIEIPMKLAGIASEQRAARVKELLQFVELSDKANTYVSRLSGGQKQRVGIARALALSPSILLCDEATSALDPQTTESILALLKKINRELGVTILLITHQMQVVQRICNKVAVMENGRIVEQGTVLDVFGSPKQEITRSFVRAIIQDEVPQSIQKIVKADGKGGKIEKLKFVGNTVNEPVIAEICQQSGVEVNILCASVQEMQDSVMCVFLLRLLGEESAIAAAEALLIRPAFCGRRSC